MSTNDKKLVLQILSVLVFPIGLYLFIVTKNRIDAQLYGILSLIGFLFVGFGFLNCIIL